MQPDPYYLVTTCCKGPRTLTSGSPGSRFSRITTTAMGHEQVCHTIHLQRRWVAKQTDGSVFPRTSTLIAY